MTMHSFADIEVELFEAHAWVKFNRPQKKNAFNPANHRAMHEVLDLVEAHPEIKVTVLTGVGDVFCGGMDLKEYFFDAFPDPARLRANFAASHGWMRRLKAHSTVTVASVNGWCVGGGMLIAMLCDIGIAADEATFCLSEVNFGIFPAGGTTWAVAQNMTRKQALYHALTADRFDGKKAVELGVVSTSVPRASLEAETKRVVLGLAAKNKEALQYTKRVYEGTRTRSFPEAQEYETAMLFDLSQVTNDAWIERGIAAFTQGRYRPAMEPMAEEKKP
jgi:trans-feruloyl-CoA hydratase/vanillin synthase